MAKKRKKSQSKKRAAAPSSEKKEEQQEQQKQPEQPKGPTQVASGYYYQFGDMYKVSKPTIAVNQVYAGRLMRLEKGMYRVMKNFIHNEIIGEKL